MVDADDLMAEMTKTARDNAQDRGKLEGMTDEETAKLFEMIGMGALKYFMLKVDPKKRMVFNPSESIDMQGNTGPFIQYTHARIKSVLRAANEAGARSEGAAKESVELSEKERGLIRMISQYPEVIKDAGDAYDPSGLANFIYDLAKEYNQFYHDHHIMKEEDQAKKQLRLDISEMTSKVIASAMTLLGVKVPERM